MSDSEKSNSRLFDLDLLRAIVTVADCGSFTTAAARLHSTQSTVSQKVRRLEEMAGHRLLERGNRDVLPTDAGDTLLGYARRLLALNDELAEALSGATVALTVRIGVPDDFAAGRTTERLAAFNRRYPQVKLEVTSGMSRDLSASYDRGELDLVLLKQRRASREALACWPEKTCWVDSARNPCIDLDPLPIVTFPPRGVYRDETMSKSSYYAPHGGHPAQTELLTDRAMFTEAYAVIPKGVMRDIVTSHLPFWDNMRMWVIARPLSGFAETFSQYIVELAPNGGSDKPEQDPNAEAVLFVVEGELSLTLQGQVHAMQPGGYAFIPPGADYKVRNTTGQHTRFHWIRKHYQKVDGVPLPEAFVTNEQDIQPLVMPDTEGRWSTTRFVDMSDMRHDMHVNIVNFEPGGVIPFAETHVMEHGLYVLEGKAVYRLNQDWVEVEAGDFMWLRAFCPQACYSGGPGRFRYLLYKDVNRHMRLTLNAPH